MFFSSAQPAFAFAAVLVVPAVVRADFVTDWTDIAVTATETEGLDANATARTLALLQLSIHDALALVDHTHALYPDSIEVPIEGPVSGEAAVAAAGHHVLAQLLPAQAAALSAQLDTALDAIEEGPARDHGVTLGVAVGTQVLAKLLPPAGEPVDGGVSDAGAGDAGPADAGAPPPPPPPGPKTPGKAVTEVDNGCALGGTSDVATGVVWLAMLVGVLRRRRSEQRS